MEKPTRKTQTLQKITVPKNNNVRNKREKSQKEQTRNAEGQLTKKDKMKESTQSQ